MSQIEYVVAFSIKPGSIDDFKAAARKVIRRVRADEPGTIDYQWYFSDDGRKCFVTERFVSSAALVAHARGAVLAEFLPELLKLSTIADVRVFGKPNAAAERVLAVLATTTDVTISRPFAGFFREPA